jgi:Mn-dependent DtxR family transcriptional regulator
MNKIFWITDMNTEECFEASPVKLTADLAHAFNISDEEAAETLSNLEEDETIQFKHNGNLFEIDIELVEEK